MQFDRGLCIYSAISKFNLDYSLHEKALNYCLHANYAKLQVKHIKGHFYESNLGEKLVDIFLILH